MSKARGRVIIGASAVLTGVILGVSGAVFEPLTRYGWITGLAFGLVGFAGAGLVAWIMVASRADARLAASDNEQSIEQNWIRRAASAAFIDVVLMLALAGTLFSVTRWEVPNQFVLAGAAGIAIADLSIRRAVIAKRES